MPAKIEVLNDSEVVQITTAEGKKFDIVIGKDSLQVFATTDLGNGLLVIPRSNSSILLKLKN